MPGQACPLEIIQMEKKREKTNQHFRSLAFLNRPPAIFTPPEITESHEIKLCSVKPAKQKDNLQAGTLTEGPLSAGRIGASASWSPGCFLPKACGRSAGVKVRRPRRPCWTCFPPQRIWEDGQRIESRAACGKGGLHHRTVAGKPRMWTFQEQLPRAPITLPPSQLCFLSVVLYPCFFICRLSPALAHPLGSIFPSLLLRDPAFFLSLPLRSSGAPCGALSSVLLWPGRAKQNSSYRVNECVVTGWAWGHDETQTPLRAPGNLSPIL